MNINEHRVREFAYQIWESEGKPHGQDSRHWDMARKLADAHADGEGQLQASITKAKKVVASGEVPAKKTRSKAKSADASANQEIAGQEIAGQEVTGKPAKIKKPKSTEEISA